MNTQLTRILSRLGKRYSLIVLLLFGFPPEGRAEVVINEILYHSSSGNRDDEYLELLNDGVEPVSLDNWSLRGGIGYFFPENTSFPASSYLVVAKSPTIFSARYPTFTGQILGGYDGRLSNGGDTLELWNASNNLVDRVTYDDKPPWPAQADGEGPSLELRNPDLDNTFPQSWTASSGFGSPGARNSRFEQNPAPVIVVLGHSPLVPGPTERVQMAFRAFDDGGISELTLQLRTSTKEGKANSSYPLFDDGVHGDGEAGDGVFGASVPPQPDGTVVEFYARARDNTGRATLAPSSAPQQNYLYQVDSGTYEEESVPLYRIVMTPRDLDTLQSRDPFSNDLLNCTLIAGSRAYYRKGIRYRGNTSRLSEFAPVKSYRIEFPENDLFQGMSELNLNGNKVGHQAVGWDLFEAFGFPTPLRQLVHLVLDNEFQGNYLQIESIEKPFLSRNFGEGDEGNLYRGESTENAEADFSYLGPDPGPYRPLYEKRTNIAEDDYSDVIDLCNIFTNTPEETFAAAIGERIDVAQWQRYFAFNTVIINDERAIYLDSGDDYFLYRRSGDNRFIILPWDLDNVFGFAREPIFRQSIPAVVRFVRHPDLVRLYYEAIENAVNAAFSEASMAGILEKYRGVLPDEDLELFELVSGWRRLFLDEVIPQHLTVELPSGEVVSPEDAPPVLDFGSSLALHGQSNPAHTVEVRVDGEPATWHPVGGTWEITLPLQASIRRVLIEAIDEDDSVAQSILLRSNTRSNSLWRLR